MLGVRKNDNLKNKNHNIFNNFENILKALLWTLSRQPVRTQTWVKYIQNMCKKSMITLNKHSEAQPIFAQTFHNHKHLLDLT